MSLSSLLGAALFCPTLLCAQTQVHVEIPLSGAQINTSFAAVSAADVGAVRHLIPDGNPMGFTAADRSMVLPASVLPATNKGLNASISVEVSALPDKSVETAAASVQMEAQKEAEIVEGGLVETIPADIPATNDAGTATDAGTAIQERTLRTDKHGKFSRMLGVMAQALKRWAPGSDEDDARAAARAYDDAMKDLDPAAAERCVRDPRMMRLLSSRPGAAAGTLSKAYALSDLAGLIEGVNRPGRLHEGLLLRLQKHASLDGLGLDKEEALLSWVRKYLPRREERVRKAIFSWDTLDSSQKDWLGKERHQAADSWGDKPLSDRDLRFWAQQELSAWAAVPLEMRDWPTFRRKMRSISTGLSPDDRFSFFDHLDNAEAVFRARLELGKLLKKEENAVAREALNGLDRIFLKNASLQLDFLGKFLTEHPELAFTQRLKDKINHERPSRPEEEFPFFETDLPRGVLKYLSRELLGTRLGRSVWSPFVDVSIGDLRGAFADYNAGDKEIRFSKGVIEAGLRVHGKQIRDLQEVPAVQQALARSLAVAFAHEGTHNNQNLWLKHRALLNVYSQEDEIEAMAVQAFFDKERTGKDSSPTTGKSFVSTGWEQSMAAGLGEFKRHVRMSYSGLLPLRAILASKLAVISRMENLIDQSLSGQGFWAWLKRALMKFIMSFHAHTLGFDFETLVDRAESRDMNQLNLFSSLQEAALVRDYTVYWVMEMSRWQQEMNKRLLRYAEEFAVSR
ncbi:MAG: hypothetical protein WCU88_07745 [Elusimicrobiota bacterium]